MEISVLDLFFRAPSVLIRLNLILARNIVFDVHPVIVGLCKASSCRVEVVSRLRWWLTIFRVEAAEDLRGRGTVHSPLPMLLLRRVASDAGEALGGGSWGNGGKLLLGSILSKSELEGFL